MNVMRHIRTSFRLVAATALVVTLSAAWGASVWGTAVYAQGGTGHPITVGDVVNGTLDADNFMQVYTLTASAGDSITVELSTDEAALAPVVTVTDARGNIVAQDADIASATTATLADVEIPNTGTYYILVMRGSGADGTASGSYTLRLSGIQQVGGQTATLENGGITFQLSWSAAVDLNMEVRDPVGGTVHRTSPGSPSGGSLDADANADCATATAESPTETITWPAGVVPAGSYEIIIYYTQPCDAGGPQMFQFNVAVNGQTPQAIVGTLNPGQQYLARMVLDPDGTWQLVNGGVNAGLNVTLLDTHIANATPMALGSTVSGVITNVTPAQAYTFDATTGAKITATMQAQSGNLDPYLVLLGPGNATLASNDDAGPNSTDASITYTLPTDGTYTVIATRYGLTIGGTEGEYNLNVVAAQPEVVAPNTTETVATPAPGAEQQGELPAGAIEVKLEWATLADVQLLVRDPSGDSVYDDSPIVPSGGILERNGNVGCQKPTDAPVSYIYWPPNRLMPGTYEVEVWYQEVCENDTRPVNFGLSVNVNGQTIINTTQPASPNSHYMITFKVEPDGTAIAGPGDFFDMANAASLNYLPELPTALLIEYGQTVTGSITDQQHFVVYAFEGQIGDVISVGMEATGGTLDPALYLISPEHVQLKYNDDVNPGENPNSAIKDVTLASTGTYYLVATHYGLHVGGTQGTFSLTLTQE